LRKNTLAHKNRFCIYSYWEKTDTAGNINSCPERTDIKGGPHKNTFKNTGTYICSHANWEGVTG
jgi:hypothetical protein